MQVNLIFFLNVRIHYSSQVPKQGKVDLSDILKGQAKYPDKTAAATITLYWRATTLRKEMAFAEGWAFDKICQSEEIQFVTKWHVLYLLWLS